MTAGRARFPGQLPTLCHLMPCAGGACRHGLLERDGERPSGAKR